MKIESETAAVAQTNESDHRFLTTGIKSVHVNNKANDPEQAAATNQLISRRL
jgi:hypothetical protein